MVVVGQLLARLNTAACINEDSFVFQHRFTIRRTRMIDEPRGISTHGRVNYRGLIN
jgi:hypothetical protein